MTQTLPNTAPSWARARLVGAALASGCLMFLSFADWNLWPFGFLFFVPLMYLADRAGSTRKAF